MLIRLTYCATCQCFYVRDGSHFATAYGHPRRVMVAVTAERIGRYENVHLRLGGSGGEINASGMLWPTGNGDTFVQYNRRLMLLSQWMAWIESKNPLLLDAFEARWDGRLVRRSVA